MGAEFLFNDVCAQFLFNDVGAEFLFNDPCTKFLFNELCREGTTWLNNIMQRMVKGDAGQHDFMLFTLLCFQHFYLVSCGVNLYPFL